MLGYLFALRTISHRAALACVVLTLGTAAATAQDRDAAEIVRQWMQSGHGNAASPSFTHWNEAGEIPATCATCHSGEGFRAFHGLDGSTPGMIDHPVATGGVIDCDTCHAPGTADLGPVRFPSGVTLSAGPANATCMTCHQGLQSGSGVREAVAGMEPDAVNAALNFLNPHYGAAAATLMGSEAAGLYQYEGKDYAGRFAHAPGASDCTSCHDPHSLEVATQTCMVCHQTDVLTAIRVSPADHDGDGDTSEGIAGEVETLTARLGTAMTDYAQRVTGTGLVHDSERYPYFFNDLNGNGMADPDEATRENRFAAWTPRLLAAAYNFQFVGKDPGAYAHNPHYVMQVLIDSIADISQTAPEGLVRP